MKKIKIIILVSIITVVVIIIGYCVYFTAGISSTYPAIRKYEYAGNFNQLINGIRNYTSTDSTVKLKITDTTGNKKNGYAIYLNIETKVDQDSIEYGLKCEEYISDGKIILSLVEAYNKTRITGGYSKEAKGVEPLVNKFEASFLTPLRNSQKLKITPLE
jgi:hypothetical protein